MTPQEFENWLESKDGLDFEVKWQNPPVYTTVNGEPDVLNYASICTQPLHNYGSFSFRQNRSLEDYLPELEAAFEEWKHISKLPRPFDYFVEI
ncbi:MAG: hypothetical protein Q4E22_01915 [Coriobacteriia bacterium]|nr:hypothetical protein [Coriobacteriia bacterium]